MSEPKRKSRRSSGGRAGRHQARAAALPEDIKPVKPGFEGGQMPLQKRLPKYGFSSRISSVWSEIRLSELNKVDGKVISLETLRSANLIKQNIKHVKIFLSGELTQPVTVKGLSVTKGARTAIEAAGGHIEAAQ